jgi:hypothetical protein
MSYRCGGVKSETRDIEVRTHNADPASPAHLGLALRTLARLMVRQHRAKGDPVANDGEDPRSTALTSVPHPSAHHGDEAA